MAANTGDGVGKRGPVIIRVCTDINDIKFGDAFRVIGDDLQAHFTAHAMRSLDAAQDKEIGAVFAR